MKLENETDEELVRKIQQGDLAATEVLIRRYQPLIRREIRIFELAGEDSLLLSSEAVLGLTQAAMEYNPEKSSFHTFATVCVRNRIRSAVTAANRHKHQPLNGAVSLDSYVGEDGGLTLEEVIPDDQLPDPLENGLMTAENQEILDYLKKNLSSFEMNILELYLQGYSRGEMAEKTEKSVKSVSNALNRVKNKLKKWLDTSGKADTL